MASRAAASAACAAGAVAVAATVAVDPVRTAAAAARPAIELVVEERARRVGVLRRPPVGAAADVRREQVHVGGGSVSSRARAERVAGLRTHAPPPSRRGRVRVGSRRGAGAGAEVRTQPLDDA